MWDKDYRPSIRPDLQYRELEDGGVVYDTTAERIHTLNLAAAYIWNCCDGSHNAIGDRVGAAPAGPRVGRAGVEGRRRRAGVLPAVRACCGCNERLLQTARRRRRAKRRCGAPGRAQRCRQEHAGRPLVNDGFGLLSDDEVWLHAESRLAHPTGRSLLLKDSAWDLFPAQRDKFVHTGEEGCRSWWLSAEDLRTGCRACPSPVAAVVLLKPATGDRPRLEAVGQTEALNALLMESMNFPEVRDTGLSVARRHNQVRAALQAHQGQPGRVGRDPLASPPMNERRGR